MYLHTSKVWSLGSAEYGDWLTPRICILSYLLICQLYINTCIHSSGPELLVYVCVYFIVGSILRARFEIVVSYAFSGFHEKRNLMKLVKAREGRVNYLSDSNEFLYSALALSIWMPSRNDTLCAFKPHHSLGNGIVSGQFSSLCQLFQSELN